MTSFKGGRMGKMTGLIAGAAVTIVGLILLVTWWYEFTFILKAIIPGVLILAGLIAVVAGVSEMKDVMKTRPEKK
jgi:hypothetical protein